MFVFQSLGCIGTNRVKRFVAACRIFSVVVFNILDLFIQLCQFIFILSKRFKPLDCLFQRFENRFCFPCGKLLIFNARLRRGERGFQSRCAFLRHAFGRNFLCFGNRFLQSGFICELDKPSYRLFDCRDSRRSVLGRKFRFEKFLRFLYSRIQSRIAVPRIICRRIQLTARNGRFELSVRLRVCRRFETADGIFQCRPRRFDLLRRPALVGNYRFCLRNCLLQYGETALRVISLRVFLRFGKFIVQSFERGQRIDKALYFLRLCAA